MNAQYWAQIERQKLCDLLEAIGPEAPTLCEGWSAAHLAAHLVLRERKPLAALGIIFGGAFARHTKRTTERLAAKPFEGLIKKLRKGPPLLLKRILVEEKGHQQTAATKRTLNVSVTHELC